MPKAEVKKTKRSRMLLDSSFSLSHFGSGHRIVAHLEAGETPDDNLVAQLFGNAADVFLDGDFGVAFDKSLGEQTAALVKLLQFALDNFGDGLGRLVLDLFGGDF